MNVLGPLAAFPADFLVGLGFQRLALVALWASSRGSAPPEPPCAWPPPRVAVQLPVRNEPAVVERLLDATAALDWPAHRLVLQLLDDSDDETPLRAAPAIARARARGLEVQHLRRSDRAGFKAGALAAGIAGTDAEVFVVLDADFLPAPDLLRRLVPHLAPGDGSAPAAMVQARWEHLDRSGWLRGAQALSLDAHFLLERPARARTGWFAFNGTAGAWRRDALEAAGGWEGDTLTEDMDLSYRALLAGAARGELPRFVYLAGVTVPGELPEGMEALLAQQRRWTRGTLQVLRKLGVRVLLAKAPIRARALTLAHLVAPLGWPVGLALQLLSPLLAWTPPQGAAAGVLGGSVLVVGVGSQLAWLGLASQLGGAERPWAERARELLGAVALGAGLSGPLSGAALAGLLGGSAPFVRTPKSGDGSRAAAAGPARDPGLGAGQRPDVAAPEARGRLQGLPLVLGLWQLAGACVLLERGQAPWALWFLPGVFGGLWVGLHDRVVALSRSHSRRTPARSSAPRGSPSGPPRPPAPPRAPQT